MKILHLATITILVLVISITSNVYAQSSSTVSASLAKVDVGFFNMTETSPIIVISGIVYKAFSQNIVLTIFNPQNQLISVSQLQPRLDGTFSQNIIPSNPLWPKGNYTVRVTSGSQNLTENVFYFPGIGCCKRIITPGVQGQLSNSTNPLSPLKQFKGGTIAHDVHCNSGLQLVLKAEYYTPACVKPETARKLVQRGWALDTTLPEPFVNKITINGLQQNYTIGQPINATVNYAGYYWYTEPDVKILDANGTQIWFNCAYCYARTEPIPSPALDTFTYIVRDYGSNKLPVINKTGTYTMIASLENKTASAEFTIVKPLMSNKIIGLENDAGVVTFGNHTYYFETPHYAHDAYVNPTQISFHDVVFTLFPSGYRGGLPIPCSTQGSDQYYWTDAKFADGAHELLHILVDDPPCTNFIPFMFSNHTNPQAGLTFYDGKMKLLVSTSITNSTANGPEFKVGPDLLGPIPHQLVFFMKSNSTAKIFVEYTSHEPNTGTMPSYSSVYVGKGGNYTPLTTSDVTINADPSSIPLTQNSDTIVVYNITAKEVAKGVYWIFLAQFCRVMPLAIDINSLTISPFDIPVQTGAMYCPAQVLDGKILGISEGTAEYKIGQPVK